MAFLTAVVCLIFAEIIQWRGKASPLFVGTWFAMAAVWAVIAIVEVL